MAATQPPVLAVQPQPQQRPLDKPTLVTAGGAHRPARTSVNIPPQPMTPSRGGGGVSEHHSPPVSDKHTAHTAPPFDPGNPFPVMYPTGDPYLVQ